jgi:acid phosphatase type 7
VRSAWIRRLLWLAGLGCLWWNAWDDPPLATDAYALEVAHDRATVGLVTASRLRLTATLRDAAGNAVATSTDPQPRRRHAFAFAGLKPATGYSYAIDDAEGGASATGRARWNGRVRTAPGEDRTPVRFAFVGDSGDQPWWVWLQRTSLLHWPARWGWFGDCREVTAIGAGIAGFAPDFVLHLGDVVYPRGRHAHYRSGFFRPFGAVLRAAPVHALLGNHDVMDARGQQLLANLRSPQAVAAGDVHHVSFSWGPVRVLALDCNCDFSGERYEAGHPAQVFLARELERSSEPWIVVATHFPMRSASRYRNRGELWVGMLPELRTHGVDLYLSGHDHCYQRFGEPDRGEPVLVVSGGGGKDLYEVRPDPAAARLASAFHWCEATVEGAVLRVRARAVGGATLDDFALPLPTGERLEAIGRRNPERAKRIRALLR